MKRLAVFTIIAVAFALFAVAGCVAADKVADEVERVGNDPLVQSVAEAVPYGDAVLGLILGGFAIYKSIRLRKLKTAFSTVVRTVEPFIPADEVARDKLKAAQGEAVTALVKAVK